MQNVNGARDVVHRVIDNVKRVIIGKDREIELAVVALICKGHILIEDVPGVGKTMLAKSLARSTGCEFSRIQFTPDLLPSDITGVSIYNRKAEEFEFKKGPIISQMVLADEINRATPKTQSALLEGMEERQVTVEGITHHLPQPFTVMATQNPIEYEGTFPLPEAQLDRFLMMLSLGYPSPEEELAIINGQQHSHPIESLESVTTAEEIVEVQEAVKSVYVDDLIKRYIIALTASTRDHPEISLGSSPRGSLALFHGAQALALIEGRDYALPDDVKGLMRPMLSHRIILSPAARMSGVTSGDVVSGVIDQVAVPGAESRGWLRR